MKEEEGKGEKRGGAGRESEEGEGRRTGIKWGRKSKREGGGGDDHSGYFLKG